MATATRIYIVKPKGGPEEGLQPEDVTRLVRATHPSHAIKHVADSMFTVTVASHDDLEALLTKGVKVEKVRHEQQELT